MLRRISHIRRAFLLLVGIAATLLTPSQFGFSQDNPAPRRVSTIDLLTMKGSKPNLSSAGEGIISIKTTDLFELGATQVKPFDSSFKIELPTGYTLYNNLAFTISSEAVFSGPNDFVFKLPSATTSESFGRLRILYADYDRATPEKPKWVDATVVLPECYPIWESSFTKAEYDKLQPNFKTHTLHALMEAEPRILVVAQKDSAIARDNFVADITLTGTAPEEVMEGRQITYDLKITNKGPDPATNITLHADPTFEFVSVTSSQDKCRMEASNVYCKFAKLAKGASISVKIVEQCRWGSYSKNTPPNYAEIKVVGVGAAEVDPIYENDSIHFLTKILEDPNQAPLAEISSPKMGELFEGPTATVNILAKAWDPDGAVKEIEFYDSGVFTGVVSIGKGVPSGPGEYQLTYEKVSPGPHSLVIKVTDNMGRETQIPSSSFFVNGLANVTVKTPKEGSLLQRLDGEILVSIEASHPNRKIKDVTVYFSEFGSPSYSATPKASSVGNGNYVARSDPHICKRHCQVQAVAVDDAGVETRSKPVNFTIVEPPRVTLGQYDGEYVRPITPEEPFDSSLGFILIAEAEHRLIEDLRILKVDVFADNNLICSYSKTEPDYNDNRLIQCELNQLAPGMHKLQAVATDSDGSVGKSEVVEVLIKPH